MPDQQKSKISATEVLAGYSSAQDFNGFIKGQWLPELLTIEALKSSNPEESFKRLIAAGMPMNPDQAILAENPKALGVLQAVAVDVSCQSKVSVLRLIDLALDAGADPLQMFLTEGELSQNVAHLLIRRTGASGRFALAKLRCVVESPGFNEQQRMDLLTRQDSSGVAPYTYAVANWNISMIGLLQEHGIDMVSELLKQRDSLLPTVFSMIMSKLNDVIASKAASSMTSNSNIQAGPRSRRI